MRLLNNISLHIKYKNTTTGYLKLVKKGANALVIVISKLDIE